MSSYFYITQLYKLELKAKQNRPLYNNLGFDIGNLQDLVTAVTINVYKHSW